MKKLVPKKKFMQLAIEEAIKGNKKGKYPMGAVVVKGDKVISKSENGLPNNIDPTAHAEVLAIRKAAKKVGTRYLNDCILYATNEPCIMCSGALVWSNMRGLVFGASVKDLENFWKKRRNPGKSKRNFIFISTKSILSKCAPKIFVKSGFMRKECIDLFKLYEKDLRR